MQILMMLLAAHPQVGRPASPSLDRAVADYDRAQTSGDREALERLIAGDFILVSSGGGTQDKRAFIADLTAPDYHLASFTVLRPVERTWTGGAIRGGVTRLSGTAAGRPFRACLRFVDVWRQDRTGWVVAYAQAARVADKECDHS